MATPRTFHQPQDFYHEVFQGTLLTAQHLKIAHENYAASRPAIRSRNVTGELLSMIRTTQTRQSLAHLFQDETTLDPSFPFRSFCKAFIPSR